MSTPEQVVSLLSPICMCHSFLHIHIPLNFLTEIISFYLHHSFESFLIEADPWIQMHSAGDVVHALVIMGTTFSDIFFQARDRSTHKTCVILSVSQHVTGIESSEAVFVDNVQVTFQCSPIALIKYLPGLVKSWVTDELREGTDWRYIGEALLYCHGLLTKQYEKSLAITHQSFDS